MRVVNINNVTEDKTLLTVTDMLKVYYMKFEKGEELPQHSLNGIGVLQVLDGDIDIEFVTGETFNLKTGDLLEFKSSVLHTLLAKERTRILLTNASYSN